MDQVASECENLLAFLDYWKFGGYILEIDQTTWMKRIIYKIIYNSILNIYHPPYHFS